MKEPQTTTRTASRPGLVRMAAILALLVVVPGVLVATLGGGDAGSGLPPAGAVDGTLLSASPKKIVVEPSDGTDEITFAVRPIDARTMDFFHLELHARDALPSRVFFETEDGTSYAVRVDDL